MNKDSVLSVIKKYGMLENCDRIVVGLSGGADSVCLLSVLNSLKDEYGFSLVAAHINHGIRGRRLKEMSRAVRRCVKGSAFRLKFSMPIFPLCQSREAWARRSADGRCGMNFFVLSQGKTAKSPRRTT